VEVRMTRTRWVTGLLLFAIFSAVPLTAQESPDDTSELINIFFDCPQYVGCGDFDYFRREIPFVNWVRDRESSVVHVLIRSQRTGGGGWQFTISFIGRDELEGEDQELEVSTSGDATSDEQRSALARQIRLGLVRYVQNTPVAERLRLTLAPLPPEPAGDRPLRPGTIHGISGSSGSAGTAS
jgi:hypothetical protein